MGQQSIFDFLARNIVTKNEILVGNRRLVLERDPGTMVVGTLDIDLVRLRTERIDRDARIQGHVQRNVVTDAHAFGHGLRRDARRVGHPIGVRSETVSLITELGTDGGACGRARNVTRTNHHRKNKLIPAIGVFQRMDVLDVHINFFAWFDVCDGLTKDIRPLLSE